MKKINNIFAYVLGYYRYHLFYSNHFKFLIRKHIFEQIEWRIYVMDDDCYMQGSCKKCGCDTTALQMANKACEKPCYPKMMSKKEWKKFKEKPKAGINLSEKVKWELLQKSGKVTL